MLITAKELKKGDTVALINDDGEIYFDTWRSVTSVRKDHGGAFIRLEVQGDDRTFGIPADQGVRIK